LARLFSGRRRGYPLRQPGDCRDPDAVTLKKRPYDLRRRRDREVALLGVHLARGERVWWLAHEIWRQLDKPKGYRVRLMAHQAAVGGAGRGAGLRVLERFLAEVDAALAPIQHPRGRRRGGAEVADVSVTLAQWRTVGQVIRRFERILAGRPTRPREPRPRPSATVLRGPWTDGACRPAMGTPKATRQSLPTVPVRD
jgi:hypothetical protein